MARIRTIKPEFWDSPSVAKASPWARLLFIAMWNWADDYGRGTANLKELEGFAFPNDDRFTDSSGNTVTFRSLVAEVSECFGVVFYEAEGRKFYAIPSWDSHQRNEKRAKQSRYPEPPERPVNTREVECVADLPTQCADAPRISDPGTGEQGNRGTGEQGNSLSSSSAVAERGPDLNALFESAYSEWPKKVERKKSFEKFKQVCKRRDADELVDDIRKFGQAYAATTDTQFVPALNVWLNGERWTDELPQPRTENGKLRPAEVGASLIAHYSNHEHQHQGELSWG